MAVTKVETVIFFQYSPFQTLLAITLNSTFTSYQFLLQCMLLIMSSWWSDEVWRCCSVQCDSSIYCM